MKNIINDYLMVWFSIVMGVSSVLTLGSLVIGAAYIIGGALEKLFGGRAAFVTFFVATALVLTTTLAFIGMSI